MIPASITRLCAMEWSKTIQYRADMILTLLAEAAFPLLSLAIWYAVASSNTQGMPANTVLTYYLFITLVKILTDSWNGIFLARSILDGTIVQDLVRPIPVMWRYVVNNGVEKIVRIAIPATIVGIIIISYPRHLDPALFQPVNIILFLVSLALAITLAFITDTIFGLVAFWLEDAFQIRRYKMMLETVSSGILIPFAFMPSLAQTIFNVLPFRYIVAAPVELLLGQAPVFFIPIQIAWIIALGILCRILWIYGLKRYAPPGQ